MAAPTLYYCDYGSGNDTTGNGTIGTPWKTIQKALDTITRDATNGDQICIKAGTAQVLGASLTLATYGTPAAGAPLVLRGYTSAANDGGIGEIDCNGATMWAATTYGNTGLVELAIHNFGNNAGIYLNGDRNIIWRCEIHKGASTPSSKTLILGRFRVIGCYIHDAGTTGTGVQGQVAICDNYVYNCPTGISIYTSPGGAVSGNVVLGCVTAGITIPHYGTDVVNNVVYSTTAATGYGIGFTNTGDYCGSSARNNVIIGYSGAGGVGIKSTAAGAAIGVLGYNAFYNNATAETLNNVWLDLGNDVTLAADPFVDAANGDFSLTAAGKTALRGLGWPAAYLGAHANTDGHVTIGAIQYGEAEAGGGGPILGSRIVRALL